MAVRTIIVNKRRLPPAHAASSITALVALAWIMAIGGCDQTGASASNTESITIKGLEFDLELALTPAQREEGLKGRTEIPDAGGMLFVFPDDQVKVQSFWMHRCLVDMDIIYLDSRGTITAMHRMKAQPPQRSDESDAAYEARMRAKSYSSVYPAQFAIELKAGTLDQLNLKVDERIELDLKRLKAMAKSTDPAVEASD